MRWLRAAWAAASRPQKVVAAVAVLIAVGAAVTLGRPGAHPSESPTASSSAPPDAAAPVLAEVRRVLYNNSGIVGLTYTFSSNEAGTIAYGGDCTSGRTTALAGNNTLTFDFLRPGVYGNWAIACASARRCSDSGREPAPRRRSFAV